MRKLIPKDAAFGKGLGQQFLIHSLITKMVDHPRDRNPKGHGNAGLNAGLDRRLALMGDSKCQLLCGGLAHPDLRRNH